MGVSEFLAVAVALGALQDGGDAGRWIDVLGRDDPDVRDDASSQLRSLGRAAWPALEHASRAHDDPDVRARAADLLTVSRLRRRLPWRVLAEQPNALSTLLAGASSEKLALIPVLARGGDETSEFLRDLARDADPLVVLAAAEVLHERRDPAAVAPLLDLLAVESCPRPGRVIDMLSASSARIRPVAFADRLEHAGPRVRVRFLQLAIAGSLPHVPEPSLLRDLLRFGDLPSRRVALTWIRERGGADLGVDVEALLPETESVLVVEALNTLRLLGRRPDPGLLAALLEHGAPAVREEAVQVVASLQERSCLPELRVLTSDAVDGVRQAALTVLAALDGESALDLVLSCYWRETGEPREAALRVLTRHPDWTAPRVRAAIATGDADRRMRAAEILTQIEGPAAAIALAGDPDESLRRWALAQCLRRPDVAGSLETVERLTRDPSDAVRFEALRTLVRLGRREHADGLRGFLDSPEHVFRHDAAETLLEMRDKPAEALARRLLDDADAPIRRLGLSALADRGDRAEAHRAVETLRDPDARLRRTAALYLGKMLSHANDPGIVARIAEMTDALEDESLQLAYGLVLDHGDARQADRVRRLFTEGRAPRVERTVRLLAHWAGDRAVGELAGLLGDDSQRNDSVYARLRETMRKSTAPAPAALEAALQELIVHEDPKVRRGAVQAAGDLAVRAHRLPGRVADPDPSVRAAAADACRVLAMAQAGDALLSRRDDEDPDVRVAVVSALAVLRPECREELERQAAGEDCRWAKQRMEAVLSRTR